VHLQEMPELRILDLASTSISDKGLIHLARLAKLRELNLKGTKITDQGLKRLQKELPGATIIL